MCRWFWSLLLTIMCICLFTLLNSFLLQQRKHFQPGCLKKDQIPVHKSHLVVARKRFQLDLLLPTSAEFGWGAWGFSLASVSSLKQSQPQGATVCHSTAWSLGYIIVAIIQNPHTENPVYAWALSPPYLLEARPWERRPNIMGASCIHTVIKANKVPEDGVIRNKTYQK